MTGHKPKTSRLANQARELTRRFQRVDALAGRAARRGDSARHAMLVAEGTRLLAELEELEQMRSSIERLERYLRAMHGLGHSEAEARSWVNIRLRTTMGRGTTRERAPRMTSRSTTSTTRRASSASSSRTRPRSSDAGDGGPEPPERWYREQIAVAHGLLEAGDTAAAAERLLYALDGPKPPKTYACPDCGHREPWPGLIERHRIVECTEWKVAA